MKYRLNWKMMMQASEVRQGTGPVQWMMVGVVLVALAMAAWGLCSEQISLMSMDHAIAGHGSIAVTIRQHCEINPKITLTRSLDGRKGIGCEYAPGKWGVTIKDPDGEVVTAFPNKSKTIEGIIRYLRNRGYK